MLHVVVHSFIWYLGSYKCTCLFFNSEKEDDDNEKREDPGDNWEEGGGGSGVEKSSGPWNKTAPVQAPPAPVIGDPVFLLKG